jgi:hypothetical protein
VSHALDTATRALAGIDGFSDEEREVIVGLLKIGRVRVEPGYEGWAPPLAGLVDRAFTWSAFDRWHAFFTARGAFPPRWDGLHVVPASEAPPAVRMAYRQRKLDLLLEWLDVLRRQASELGRYTRQGVRVRIVRQEDGHRCPACEIFDARETRDGSETMPPLHPGCRCVLMAVVPVAPQERNGTHRRHRSRLSS